MRPSSGAAAPSASTRPRTCRTPWSPTESPRGTARPAPDRSGAAAPERSGAGRAVPRGDSVGDQGVRQVRGLVEAEGAAAPELGRILVHRQAGVVDLDPTGHLFDPEELAEQE